MYAIETNALTKEYQDKKALNGINIHVKQGDVYGFIGRNGAGKTTTINILLSMIHKTGGMVKINDKEITFSDEQYKRQIGFVPDVPVFPSYMTAEEYLVYTCELYHMDPAIISTKVQEVLEFVDLQPSKKRVSSFSRGMKQRLAIAQALVHDPEILIMDEPTSALDPIGRKDVMNIIVKLKGAKTIFYSTHILEDVEKVCDHIGIIDDGNVLLEDTMVNIQKTYFRQDMILITKEDSKDVYDDLQTNGLGESVIIEEDYLRIQPTKATTAQDVLQEVINNGFTVIEFKRKNASLEDVFMAITNEKTT